jgi:flagellar biosynthesis protein FlhF
MKIKRYFASDTRKALRQVRDDLGPDAIIISNRSVDDGVEILAAEDFDEELASKGEFDTRDAEEVTATPPATSTPTDTDAESSNASPASEEVLTSDAILKALKKKPATAKSKNRPAAPKADKESDLIATMRNELAHLRGMMENQFNLVSMGQWSQNSPIRSELVQHLTRVGLTPALAAKLVGTLANVEKLTPQLATRNALALLTREIPINNQSILEQRGAVALIGPAGAGKTTTIAKLTSQFTRLHGNRNIILVSADNHRIGAHEQLLAYSELFDVPLLRARDYQEIRQIIHAVGNQSLVLVDTGSLTQQDLRSPQNMPTMQKDLDIRNYLVLPATNQTPMLERIVSSFSHCSISGAIITKVDEAPNLGGALTAIINGKMPVSYWSDGMNVDSHLYQATAKHLVAKAVTMVNRKRTTPQPTVAPASPRPQAKTTHAQ